MRYVDSLLVFNSMVNPYRHYEIIENIKVKNKEKVKTTNDNEAIQLDKAPEQYNMRMEKYDPQSYSYIPEDKDVSD